MNKHIKRIAPLLDPVQRERLVTTLKRQLEEERENNRVLREWIHALIESIFAENGKRAAMDAAMADMALRARKVGWKRGGKKHRMQQIELIRLMSERQRGHIDL